MKKLYLYISLILCFLSTSSCGLNDLGCLFEFPNETSRLYVQELVSDHSLSNYSSLRSYSFVGEASSIPYVYELRNFSYPILSTKAKFDYVASGFFNYGADEDLYLSPPKLEFFKDKPFETRFDYNQETNTFLFLDITSQQQEIPGLRDSVFTRNYFLLEFDNSNSQIDTLYKFKTTFIDSIKLESIHINERKYSIEGNVVFSIEEEILEVGKYPTSDNYGAFTYEKGNKYLIQISDQNSFDTLLTITSSDSSYFYFTTTPKGIVTYRDKRISLLYDSGDELFLYNGELPYHFSVDGSSATSKRGTHFFNFDTKEFVDLSIYFENIHYSYPYKNIVAILTGENRSSINLFNISTKTIIDSVNLDNMPEFESLSFEDSSIFWYENPIFTHDGKLIFMALKGSYLLDPEFKCYDD